MSIASTKNTKKEDKLILREDNYTDFKNILSELNCHKSIFYVTNGTNLFNIYAVWHEKNMFIWSDLGTQPGSFTTDFPSAIQLTQGFSF